MPHAYLKSSSSPAPTIFCQKVAFTSRKEACKAMNNNAGGRAGLVQGGSNRPMSPYFCDKGCKMWHVGHEPLKKRSIA